VAKGLKEICFTPHLEVDVRRRYLDWFVRVNGRTEYMHNYHWLECYFRDIEKARAEFSFLGLQVKAGLEVGFERGLERAIEKIIVNYPFDYVLGSIHCLEHRSISAKRECRRFFASKDLKSFTREYFEILKDLVDSSLFNCVGHIDLYKRYGYDFFGEEINDIHLDKVEDVFRVMARKGTGLEINTSSRRRGLVEFHPSGDILALAKKAGVRIFTVGSDAHRRVDIGDGVMEAAVLLRKKELKLTTFEKRMGKLI
jgi:histidinol-phosphatase (PHP family)